MEIVCRTIHDNFHLQMSSLVIRALTMAVINIKRAKRFFNDFFNNSSVHGFAYIGDLIVVHIIEKLFWSCLICIAIYFCVDFSFKSWDRYLHKATVVSVSLDYYYWNTSLPSLTICPMSRLSKDRYEEYVK